MSNIQVSTAKNIMVFMTDSVNHISGKTGLTLTITASKDGAAFATITPTVTDRGNGWYNLALTSTDTNTLGDLALHITGTGADPTDYKHEIVAYNPLSATNLGLSKFGDIETDTQDIQSRLPAALVSGRIDSSVGAMANNTITAAAAAADFGTEVGTAVWGTTTRILTAGTNIVLAKGTGITGLNDLSAAQVNTEVDTAISDVGLTTTVTGRIDAAISSRMATFTYTPPDNATIGTISTNLNALVTDIGSNGSGLTALPWNTAWDAEVQSEVTDALNAYDPPTNAEMNARTIASADYATSSGLTTVNSNVISVGQSVDSVIDVTDKLDTALVADGPVYQFTANALELAPTGGGGGITPADVWSYSDRFLTAGTNIILAKGTGVIGFNDISESNVRSAIGMASANLDTQLGNIPTAIENADAVRDEIEVELARLDADITSRMETFTYTAPDNAAIGDIKTKTDQLTFGVANSLNSNITHVNETSVTGNGTTGNEWGPE